MSFTFVVNFWVKVDENGSMTWTVNQDKIFILYFFNGENIDLENILFSLNTLVRMYGLDTQDWKLSFTMQVSNSEYWNYDYFKRMEFICRKGFFYLFNYLLNKNAKVQELFIYCGNVLAFCCFF